MSQKLVNRVALITGANRGIGRALAKAFAKEGAECILAGRNQQELDLLSAQITAEGAQAKTLLIDLSSDNSIQEACTQLKSMVDRVDVFIANAAYLGARLPIATYPIDTFRQTFQVNVFANLLLLQGLDDLLKKSSAAKVIMMSALVATQAKIGTGSYAVSKAALESLARIYMIEHKDTNITVNTVSPGATRTLMRAAAVPSEDPMSIKAPEAITDLFVELSQASCAKQGEWIDADVWLKNKS